jgi:glycerophosphoryl diester phosphodiesterase
VKPGRFVLHALLLAACVPWHAATAKRMRCDAAPRDAMPLVIAHRGAGGYRPEHTVGACDLAAPGDAEGELCAHLRAGIDGFFTDHPDRGVAALQRP